MVIFRIIIIALSTNTNVYSQSFSDENVVLQEFFEGKSDSIFSDLLYCGPNLWSFIKNHSETEANLITKGNIIFEIPQLPPTNN